VRPTRHGDRVRAGAAVDSDDNRGALRSGESCHDGRRAGAREILPIGANNNVAYLNAGGGSWAARSNVDDQPVWVATHRHAEADRLLTTPDRGQKFAHDFGGEIVGVLLVDAFGDAVFDVRGGIGG